MCVEISSLLDDQGAPHCLPLSKNWGGIRKTRKYVTYMLNNFLLHE